VAVEPEEQRVWLADNAENSVYPLLTSLKYVIMQKGGN
jgi:hypothetical protein